MNINHAQFVGVDFSIKKHQYSHSNIILTGDKSHCHDNWSYPTLELIYDVQTSE